MKILVTGDSFATLTQDNSHWASIWADQHGFTTNHVSYPGQNYVKIVQTLENRNTSDYDAVIFCMTDFLRMSINNIESEIPSGDSAKWMVDFLLGYYKDKAFLNSIISNHNDDYVEWPLTEYTRKEVCMTKHAIDVFYDLENVRQPTNENDKRELTRAGLVYSMISLRWLIKSNWFALSSFAKDCKYKHNIPLICVTSPTKDWKHWRANHLPEECIFWNSSLDFTLENDIGDNHLSLQDANHMADLFDNFCQQNNLIKTIFNK